MKNLKENDAKKSLTNHFRGVEKSHIFYDASTKKWVLESIKDPTKKLETVLGLTEDIPIGKYQWIQKKVRISFALKTAIRCLNVVVSQNGKNKRK